MPGKMQALAVAIGEYDDARLEGDDVGAFVDAVRERLYDLTANPGVLTKVKKRLGDEEAWKAFLDLVMSEDFGCEATWLRVLTEHNVGGGPQEAKTHTDDEEADDKKSLQDEVERLRGALLDLRVSADEKHSGNEGSKSLSRAGVKLTLPTYDGKLGGCREWWTAFRQMLVDQEMLAVAWLSLGPAVLLEVTLLPTVETYLVSHSSHFCSSRHICLLPTRHRSLQLERVSHDFLNCCMAFKLGIQLIPVEKLLAKR